MKILAGGTLFDGTGRPTLNNSAVVIDGERIVDVGSRDSVTYGASSEVFDISGMTILPGLIDCHDHLGHNSYTLMDRWELDAPASLRHMRTAQVLKEKLDLGYTTFRDGGGLDQGFKMAVEEGLIPGPRLMLSIGIISPTGGLADARSPSGHCRPKPTSSSVPSGVADGADAVRAKVREMVRMGADVIKCATTGGASSRPGHGPKDGEFNREEIRALVDEAHAMCRKVMCHALGGPGLRLALEAGVDTIEHGTYLNEDPDLIPLMAEMGTFYVPTMLVYVFHRDNPQAHIKPRARELQTAHIESIQKAVAAGVRVVAGTDAGGWGHPLNARELECMVEEAGMTPEQALAAATGLAGQCLGLEDEVGTVERGKLADLIVVDGDPLKDITVLQNKDRIKLVLKGGRIHIDRRAKADARGLSE